MSYVMQGAQRLGRGVAFGAVEPTDGWYVYDFWSLTRDGEVYTGKTAYPDPRPPGPSGGYDPTVAEWIATQCSEGKLVYRGTPYMDHKGRTKLDLYADTKPLYQGFKSSSKGTVLQPQACLGQKKPPAQPTAPAKPELSEDEKLFVQACFQSFDDKKPVALERTIDVLGMRGNVVRFDEAKNDCVLELSETSGKSKHLIFGAMALVAVAGGVYLYRKRAR